MIAVVLPASVLRKGRKTEISILVSVVYKQIWPCTRRFFIDHVLLFIFLLSISPREGSSGISIYIYLYISTRSSAWKTGTSQY